MFNTQDWEKALEAKKAEIEQHPDKRWLQTVNLRYGAFLAGQAKRHIERLEQFGMGVMTEPKGRTYAASELMTACSTLHAASALIQGNVITPDPVGAEAMMRLHDQASSGATIANDAPVEAPGSAPGAVDQQIEG